VTVRWRKEDSVRRTIRHSLSGRSALAALAFGFATALPAAPAAGPVAGAAAYALVKGAAVKWQPDAEMFDFATMPTAPLDSEGRSAEWTAKWSSNKAGKVNFMTVKNGTLTTFEAPTAGGRVIVLGPASILDTKKLLGMADAKGGAEYRAKGATVSAGLVQNPSVGPLWHLSYTGKNGKEIFHVAIEANGGRVTVLTQ
jgi:hypothetical protein